MSDADINSYQQQTARIKREHLPECAYRLASTGRVPVQCDHGFDCCPECDPCTCAAVRLKDAKRLPIKAKKPEDYTLGV